MGGATLERQGVDARRRTERRFNARGRSFSNGCAGDPARARSPSRSRSAAHSTNFARWRSASARSPPGSSARSRPIEATLRPLRLSAVGFVVARGILERMVLRDRNARGPSAALEARAGSRRTGHGSCGGSLRARRLARAGAGVRDRRRESRRARTRPAHPPPASCSSSPTPASRCRSCCARHARSSATCGRQLSSKIFLRAPAIAGLIAAGGSRTPTRIRRWKDCANQFGFGGRRAIGGGTMSWLNYVVPLLAAALFSYVAALVAARVQRRYAPGAGDGSLPGSPRPLTDRRSRSPRSTG